ncbi:hypothetical protein MMC25_001251 [Agyrium rufum]|nr:hypothetical protein [Agyrium rufum]
MSQPKINIIGAGLGGLTLSRCLLKRGIPSTIYEKSSPKPRYAYGITLYPSSYRPLLAVLDLDEQAFVQRVAVDGAVGRSGTINPHCLVRSADIEPASFRAHRGKLELLLREGLDIKWGQSLERIGEAEDSPDGGGGMVLCMQSGQRISSAFTIGADGVHSKTKKSLLPSIQPKILPFAAFNGKRRVKQSLFCDVFAPYMKDSTIIEIKHRDTVLHVSINELPTANKSIDKDNENENENENDDVNINWIYSRPSHGPSDALYTPNRPLASATDIPEEFYQEISALQDPKLNSNPNSNQELDLSPPFKEIFSAPKIRSERVLSWLMRSVLVDLPDLREAARKGVLFMGDSVHGEPILGGEGANAVMRDAVELAERIAGSGTKGVREWYEVRYGDWVRGVERSERVIAEMHAEAEGEGRAVL